MSDSTISVSKGVFVFKNGYEPQTSNSRQKQAKEVNSKNESFEDELWYQSYSKEWEKIEKKIKKLNEDTFTSLLRDLVNFVKYSYKTPVAEIPTAMLLTGINMPDHSALFHTLNTKIRNHVSPHSATLYAEECNSMKNMIENMIDRFVNVEGDDSVIELDSDGKEYSYIQKNQCTFSLLKGWYDLSTTGKYPLIITIPDFENFNHQILQGFILILSFYLNVLPFVLIFGIATSPSALHKSLPYQVSSKISVKIFQSHSSVVYLNQILEKVFLTSECPFQLGGKLFTVFTDQFLYYDLSVKGFIKNIKYCMLEHYSCGNAMALCTDDLENMKIILDRFTHDDFEKVRLLPTFKNHMKNEKSTKLMEDSCLKELLCKKLENVYYYFENFYIFLKCLHVLVQDLPNAPLGKQFRELYGVAISKYVTTTNEFKQSFKLLSFQSKDEIVIKLKQMSKILQKESEIFVEEIDSLNMFIFKLNNLNNANNNEDSDSDENESNRDTLTQAKTRSELREKLLKMTSESKRMNKYQKLRFELLTVLIDMFDKYLQLPDNLLFHEIFVFDNVSVKSRVEGLQRSALHEAMTNPHAYLSCECCVLNNDSDIVKTMPDICILYKLHLECGKMINLFDLLQSFNYIIDSENNGEIKPEVQARFTQAVAELEFLGFIKSYKRKPDHVTRLTWSE